MFTSFLKLQEIKGCLFKLLLFYLMTSNSQNKLLFAKKIEDKVRKDSKRRSLKPYSASKDFYINSNNKSFDKIKRQFSGSDTESEVMLNQFRKYYC